MEIIKQIETPCFLIHTQKVDSLVDNLISSLAKYWLNGIVGYSFKTNNLPWVISHMKEKGLWAEVVSSDEYQLAKELGFDSSKIIFNGPAKEKEEFIEAIENESIVNIDSTVELRWLLECDKSKFKNSNIGLRVNFCIEDYCQGESQCGTEDGRFGFSYEMGDLYKAIIFLEENNIPLSGLHLHCSSKTRSLNIYKAIAKIAVKIVSEYNLNLNYIDIGGGYFGGVPDKPTFNDYFQSIHEILMTDERLKNITVIVEPGMSVIGAGIDYLTNVIDVKQTKNNDFVLLNGSRIHIDPLMKKKNYTYHIIRNSKNGNTNFKNQILCGFTCMESDRFFTLNDNALSINDYVIFEKVGAYTIGLAPQFIEFYPAIYAINNDKLILVQPKSTAKKFIR